MMEMFRFDELFREMVMLCVWTTSFSVLIEGSPLEVFHAQCGVRHSDPLSPFLFVVVIEYLSRLTKQAVWEGKLKLYTNGGTKGRAYARLCGRCGLLRKGLGKVFYYN